MKKIVVIFLFLLPFVNVYPEKADLFDNTYLGTLISPLNIGLGRTGTVLDNNPYGFLINPAFLVNSKSQRIYMVFQAETDDEDSNILDILNDTYNFTNKAIAFGAVLTEKGAFSWKPLADIKRHITTETDSSEIVKDIDYYINQYALSISEYDEEYNLSMGITMKYLSGVYTHSKIEKINDSYKEPEIVLSKGNGFSFDLGLGYNVGNWAADVSYLNVWGKMYWDETDDDKIDSKLNAFLSADTGIFLVSGGVSKIFDDDEEWLQHYGLKYQTSERKSNDLLLSIISKLEMRIGVWGEDVFDEENRIHTAGFSIYSPHFIFQFAFEGENVNVFSQDGYYKYQFGVAVY